MTRPQMFFAYTYTGKRGKLIQSQPRESLDRRTDVV